MSTWTRSPSELIELFQSLLPDDPQVERKSMFGYPCAFVAGHMFMGLHQDTLLLRLSPPDRESFGALGGRPFAPMGRPMKEYLGAPDLLSPPSAPPLGGDLSPALKPWVERSLAFARGLPPKVKKAPKKKS